MLTRFCQSDRTGAALTVDPVVTSSLWTGRALEKARFFCNGLVAGAVRIPLTACTKRNSVRFHEVGQSDREQKQIVERVGIAGPFPILVSKTLPGAFTFRAEPGSLRVFAPDDARTAW
jgi:hypothetical protein